jgi:hypothetical protein
MCWEGVIEICHQVFIWSPPTARALRHQYLARQTCAVPAMLCLAALVLIKETHADRPLLGSEEPEMYLLSEAAA